MFGSYQDSGTNSGLIAITIVLIIFGFALAKDHVFQDKIVSIYNRVFKKYPF